MEASTEWQENQDRRSRISQSRLVPVKLDEATQQLFDVLPERLEPHPLPVAVQSRFSDHPKSIASSPILYFLDSDKVPGIVNGGKQVVESTTPSRNFKTVLCPKTKKGRIICCSSVILVLVGLSLILFFYIPRYPTTQVYTINLQNLSNLSTPFSFSYKDPRKPNFNELRLQMNLSMTVGTYNPNLYGLLVDEINLVAKLLVNESYVYDPLKTNSLISYGALVKVVGSPPPSPLNTSYSPSNSSQIGTALYKNIYFPSKQWTNYTMIFQFDYSPDPIVGILRDPTILDLADVCGITSRYTPKGRGMRIGYTATTSIAAFKALGFSPSLSNELRVSCPFRQSQITEVIQRVQKGSTPYDAIKAVFGQQ
ncbi:hypothetical protein BDR26DRAFT_1006301 [Obelidium mucronatum]|nr:hypothetical protein BDR26DRAFT_1006301 [Obelidium mucronatum]